MRSAQNMKTAGRKEKQPSWSREVSGTDRVLFVCGLIAAAVILPLFFSVYTLRGEDAPHLWQFPCPFYTLTGLYCPGCGLQRAVRALFTGHPLQSLLYHPFALCGALYLLVFLVSQGINRISRGRTAALCFRDWHLWAFLALILLQWIVKNILLFV